MKKRLEYQLWVDLACKDRKSEMEVGELSSQITNAWKGGDASRTCTTSWLLNITTHYTKTNTKRNDTTTMNTLMYTQELTNLISTTISLISLPQLTTHL